MGERGKQSNVRLQHLYVIWKGIVVRVEGEGTRYLLTWIKCDLSSGFLIYSRGQYWKGNWSSKFKLLKSSSICAYNFSSMKEQWTWSVVSINWLHSNKVHASQMRLTVVKRERVYNIQLPCTICSSILIEIVRLSSSLFVSPTRVM